MALKTKFSILFLLNLLLAGPLSAALNGSVYGSFLHFLGETKLKHFGGGLKIEYHYSDFVGIYGGVAGYSQSSYTAVIEDVNASETNLIEMYVPGKVFFIQSMIGSRFYFVGEMDPVIPGAISLYGLGEAGLLVGVGTNEVAEEGPSGYVPPQTGTVKGSFYNYTVGAGIGAERRFGSPMVFVEAKVNRRIDEANSYLVTTRIPWGFAYNIGLRIPLTVD